MLIAIAEFHHQRRAWTATFAAAVRDKPRSTALLAGLIRSRRQSNSLTNERITR